jgi:hypothetical protein
MTESFEYKGKWYLPDQDPKTAISGIIKFDPKEGARLELIGGFPRDKGKIQIIWGLIAGSKAVTLYNSFEISRKNILDELETADYLVSVIFIGGWFDNEADLVFNKATSDVVYLDNWLNTIHGFKVRHDKEKPKTTIEYELPEPIEIPLPQKVQLILQPSAKGPTLRRVQKEVTITQKIQLIIQSKKKLRFRYILKELFHFQNFLTVITQKPIYPKELSVFFKVKNEKKFHEARVFYQLRSFPEKTNEYLDPKNFILLYPSIKENLISIVQTWYAKKKILEPTITPYITTFQNTTSFTSDKFLELARAIEAFDRETTGERNLIYVKRVLRVLKKYRKAYNGVFKIKKFSTLATRIKTFRNDFTHSNPMTSRESKKYLETHYMNEKMKVVLACALLNEAGVTLETLKKGIEETVLYNHIKYRD